MKYFISLISALLFTFTVFAQGVLEIKQSRQTLKNLLADDQAQNIVDVFIVVIEALTVHLGQLHDLLDRYPAAGLGGHHYPRHSHDQFTESRLAQKSASPR